MASISSGLKSDFIVVDLAAGAFVGAGAYVGAGALFGGGYTTGFVDCDQPAFGKAAISATAMQINALLLICRLFTAPASFRDSRARNPLRPSSRRGVRSAIGLWAN